MSACPTNGIEKCAIVEPFELPDQTAPAFEAGEFVAYRENDMVRILSRLWTPSRGWIYEIGYIQRELADGAGYQSGGASFYYPETDFKKLQDPVKRLKSERWKAHERIKERNSLNEKDNGLIASLMTSLAILTTLK